MLLDYLQGQRRHVLEAIDGLADEQMRRATLPSGWSPVQLLHHLAVDDERFWIRAVVGGDAEAQGTLSDDGWQVPDELSVSDVVDLYRHEAELGDGVLAEVDLAAPPVWWPSFMGQRWLLSGGEVVMHLIVETAAHAGHLDVVRELADGTQWRVVNR